MNHHTDAGQSGSGSAGARSSQKEACSVTSSDGCSAALNVASKATLHDVGVKGGAAQGGWFTNVDAAGRFIKMPALEMPSIASIGSLDVVDYYTQEQLQTLSVEMFQTLYMQRNRPVLFADPELQAWPYVRCSEPFFCFGCPYACPHPYSCPYHYFCPSFFDDDDDVVAVVVVKIFCFSFFNCF